MQDPDNYMILARRPGQEGTTYAIAQDVLYPPDDEADLAAMILPDTGPWQCFHLPEPEVFDDLTMLGDRVVSYGFPVHETDATTPRMMFGHIQRRYEYTHKAFSYSAFECGFPAFGGQSGSPALSNSLTLPHARRNALAVVTANITYEQRDNEDDDLLCVSASWAIGLSLAPFRDWLMSL